MNVCDTDDIFSVLYADKLGELFRYQEFSLAVCTDLEKSASTHCPCPTLETGLQPSTLDPCCKPVQECVGELPEHMDSQDSHLSKEHL